MSTQRSDDLRPALLLRRHRPWVAATFLFAAAAGGGAVGAATNDVEVPHPAYCEMDIPVVQCAPASVEAAFTEAPAEPVEVAEPAEVAAEPVEAVEPATTAVLQVMGRGPERWALLAAQADQAWLQGDPVVAFSDKQTLWVERAVALDEASLPAAVLAWKGRAVDVVDRDGNRCAAEIEMIAGRQFGLEDAPSKVGATVPGDWHQTAVVGKLRIDDTQCGAPLFAVHGSEAFIHGASAPAKGKLARRATRAFRRLPGYQKLQAEWTGDDYGGSGPWDAGDGSHEVFDLRLGAARYVLVAGNGAGCGGPDGQLVALWRVAEAGGKPRLGELVFADAVALFAIDAVFDADGDQLPDFIVGQDLATAALLSAGGAYGVEPGFSIDYDFCRC